MHAALGVALSVGLFVLWVVAGAAGAIDKLEKGIERTAGFDSFAFSTPAIVAGIVVIGILFAVIGTFLSVLLAVFYNLASEWSGGLQIVVLEEVVVPPNAQQTTARPGVETRGQAALVQSRTGVPAST
jgi:hypothetical protein